jgi:hypothetical protein
VPVWGWVIILVASGGLVYLSFRYSEKINGWMMKVMTRRM